MAYAHLVIALALLEYLLFLVAVSRARARYNVRAPATTGNETFERYFRVQMNTLEQLVIFLPGMLLFCRYMSPLIGAAIGVVFIIGRALYFRAYVADPARRGLGAMLTGIANVALLLGAIAGTIRALAMG